MEKILKLRLPVYGVYHPNRKAAPAHGQNGFPSPKAVAGDERVGHADNFIGRTVVPFHEQYARAGIIPLEIQQGVGPRGAESVNALVFVSDQKQISIPPRQQTDNRVLNF